MWSLCHLIICSKAHLINLILWVLGQYYNVLPIECMALAVVCSITQKVEPGLEQSESFYSLTYTVLFAVHVIAAVTTGLLFNLIPTWYLFLVSTLSHTLGYLLYALATNGWMMILARALAGLQSGSVDSLIFAYYSVSFEKYKENLKTLGKFEEKKAARAKGYLFSSATFGYISGYALGVGK